MAASVVVLCARNAATSALRLASPTGQVLSRLGGVASVRCLSSSFKASDLHVELTKHGAEKPDVNKLVFGKAFTDHMLCVEWTAGGGWQTPRIQPFQNLSLHPASSSLHYSIELFEGMKAFRGVDGKIRMFRPMLNMERMHRTALRASLPGFDQAEFCECIRKLVEVDKDWVPQSTQASLYLRPTFISTEQTLGVSRPSRALLFVILSPVGPYFSTGSFNPVALLADPQHVRAFKGGVGDCKLGGNYGPTIHVQNLAMQQGCQQVLWLYGADEQITEAGTMNLFMYWINEQGEEELATPPLDGIILPGVTRQSLLDLARQWGEFKVAERYITMADLQKGLREKRVKEMFGAGTACVVCPIDRILYKGENLHVPTMEHGDPKIASRFLKVLTDIQYGRMESDWMLPVV